MTYCKYNLVERTKTMGQLCPTVDFIIIVPDNADFATGARPNVSRHSLISFRPYQAY